MARAGGGGPRGAAGPVRPLHQDGRATTASSTVGSSTSIDLQWPTEYRYPDRTYRDHLDLDIGGVRAELHHAKGETDDHTWTWFPDPRVLCCGDLFIWASPTPAIPRRSSATRWSGRTHSAGCWPCTTSPGGGPEVLLPGHGYPVMGADRVRQALTEAAELLESLVEQTLALMNAGARLDEVIHAVTPPARLMERPYLRPVYDEPEFIVRTVWRLYGGWWDGNPATLKPAPERSLARSWPSWPGARDAGRPGAGAGRAGRRRRGDASLRLAGHLAELAWLAAPAAPGSRPPAGWSSPPGPTPPRRPWPTGVFSWAARESGNGRRPTPDR